MTPGLVGLVMIVRDEAHGIGRTLSSFRPFVDAWTILDTGSTDGTQEIVRRRMEGAPGVLHEGPFVDFSAARNLALDLHGEATSFWLMVDADDELEGGADLRAFCARFRDDRAGAYGVRRSLGSVDYDVPLLSRSSARWRYRGRVHEALCPPADVVGAVHGVRVPGVRVVHRPASEQSERARRQRWERDLAWLREDVSRDPGDPRWAFYLAQTYECLGRLEEAETAYCARLSLGGWEEEYFVAALRRARVLERLGRPWVACLEAYLAAHAVSPGRAEPLCDVARRYVQDGQYSAAYLFARRAAELLRPSGGLFIEPDVYAWRSKDLLAISGAHVGRATGDVEAVRISTAALEEAGRARARLVLT